MKNFQENKRNIINFWFFFLTVSIFYAQNKTKVNIKNFDNNNIPESIIAAIKNVERVDIYNIGVEVLQDSIIVADKVVFNEGAVASLNNFNWSSLIVYADELVFSDPRMGAQILRKIDVEASKPVKPNTPNTMPNAGRNGSHGNNGTNGTSGSSGKKGNTLRIPDIWFFTNDIVTPSGSKIRKSLSFRIFVPGINGSNGGDGGNGGKGGDGGDGRNGSCSWGICSRGPGNGGNGGQAGSGGRAGDGGDGGNGGNVYFVGPKRVIDVLQFTSIQNNGADAGLAGSPGKTGLPGRGGARGSRPCNCTGGSRGSNGVKASPENLGKGKIGKNGNKGETVAYVIDDIREIMK